MWRKTGEALARMTLYRWNSMPSAERRVMSVSVSLNSPSTSLSSEPMSTMLQKL